MKNNDLENYLYQQLGSWYKVEEEIKRFKEELKKGDEK